MKKVLLNPDSANGGTPPKETQQQMNQRLIARNAELEGRIDKYETAEAQRAADEKIIVEKMAHGLSRQQAINVIHRQRDFDAGQEKKSKVQNRKSKVGFAASKA
ncbi:MAG TPA: hypothetical protein VKV04_14220 [Verrucomicrobiae bacterium]|nr:hypothetical protein [Verrucomicrobiae bacterium]